MAEAFGLAAAELTAVAWFLTAAAFGTAVLVVLTAAPGSPVLVRPTAALLPDRLTLWVHLLW